MKVVINQEEFDTTTLPQKPYAPIAQCGREIAAEGAVLLKNDKNVLPVLPEETVSLFGRTQIDYYKSGTGSGGLVNVEYTVNILDGFRNCGIRVNEDLVHIYQDWLKEHPFDKGAGWAQEPWSQLEMVPDDETVKIAAEKSDKAIIVLGRLAGEDRDNTAEPGSYLLSPEEEQLLAQVSKYFEKICVVLNVGNIIDMKWAEKYHIPAILYVWQGGMEGGNSVADVISGAVSPSGKLTDTIACDIADYPSTQNFGDPNRNIYAEDIYVGYRYFETFAKDKVLYPFGFGLSYTTFSLANTVCSDRGGKIHISLDVTNTGAVSGKETVQIYFSAPQGKLGRPCRELAGFAKTKCLAPGETEHVTIAFDIDDMAAYDDSGITGYPYSYVLEKGEYVVYVGTDVRSAQQAYIYPIDETIQVQQLSQIMAGKISYKRMKPQKAGDGFVIGYEDIPVRTYDLMERIQKNHMPEIPFTGDRGIQLKDVYDGKHTLSEFIAQFDDEALASLSRGEGMSSPKVTAGTGSAFGGLTAKLQAFGIPAVCTTDGPSGIRLDSGAKASSIPNGTLLACTWNPEFVEKLYALLGVELLAYHIDTLLGPGLNIHRSPLNGRNFEYFSEDPYVTGVIAAACTRGIAQSGATSCIKHFCANSQESRRSFTNSVISERAIREIYTRGFKIAVQEGGARSLMTSYNPVNGIWCMGNYDLNTTLLRGEWGYEGFVMTDWWAKANEEGEEGTATELRAMVRAQNDVYMVTPDAEHHQDNILSSLADGTLQRADLQRNAANILSYILKTPAFMRYMENGCKPDYAEDIDMADFVTAFALENPESGAEYNFTLKNNGTCGLFCTYSVRAESLAQFPVNVFINGVNAATLGVNGTNGQEQAMSHAISVAAKEIKLKLKFGEAVHIHKIELREKAY